MGSPLNNNVSKGRSVNRSTRNDPRVDYRGQLPLATLTVQSLCCFFGLIDQVQSSFYGKIQNFMPHLNMLRAFGRLRLALAA